MLATVFNIFVFLEVMLMRKRKTMDLIFDKKEKSDHRFTINISKSEFEELEVKCKILKCTRSEFIRMLLDNQVHNYRTRYFKKEVQQSLLDKLSSLMTDLDAEHRALINSANNLNQIAKKLNSNSPFSTNDTQIFVQALRKLNSSIKSFRVIFSQFDDHIFDLWKRILRR